MGALIQTEKDWWEKNNHSPGTVPLTTMNPQATEETIREDKEKIGK